MDQVDEVKSKVDIVEVISSYVPLKKAGRNFSGLCPFHGEKTPSFMVSPDRQVFKCFGCGEGGDAITFLEKVEGWEFREALEELAKKAGVKLKSFRPTEGGKQKEKLVEINNLASKFYSYILAKHKLGESGREYLKKRGIREDVYKKFGVGFAPVGWESTFNFLTKRGFGGADIAAAGLVIAREGRDKSLPDGGQGFYDRFRGRLVFPLRDARGATLGFSGRVISEGERGPKYVNSPETAIFNKGSLLFGLDVTRDAVREKNEALLVEGEFDVLSAYQAGVLNVVASKGTALTEKQVGILSRLCESIVLSFDTDLAGDKASRRGIEMLDAAGLVVKVLSLGKFKDPDEFASADAAGFKKAIGTASNIYDYYIGSVIKRYDVKKPEGKKKVGAEILPILSKISDDMLRAHYISKLSAVLDLDIGLVSEAVSKRTDVAVPIEKAADALVEDVILEKYFLALLFSGERVDKAFFEQIDDLDFEDSSCRALWGKMRAIISDPKARGTRVLVSNLPGNFKSFLDELYLIQIDSELLDSDARQGELKKLVLRIRQKSIARQMKEISSKMKDAEQTDSESAVEKLKLKFNELSNILKGLNNAKS